MSTPASRFQIPQHFGRRPDAQLLPATTLEEQAENAEALAQHQAALAVFDELALRELKLDWLSEQLSEHIDQLRRKLHGKSRASAKDLYTWGVTLGLSGDPFPSAVGALPPVTATPAATGTQIGSKLWSMANTLRSAGVRPADYQAYILPILMFKVVNDRNEGKREAVVAEQGEQFWEENKEDLTYFSIPAGCSFAEQSAVQMNLGESLRTALLEIEKNNSELAGVFLATDYANLSDKAMRDMYRVLADVSFSPEQTSQDAIGQAYEYLLGQFADAAGAKAGQFFTPIPVAQLLVLITDPVPGESVYDPTCGSGGLLNTAAEHVATNGLDRSWVVLRGQEIDEQSHAIAKVNMFLHGNAGQIRRGDTLTDPKFVSDGHLDRFEVIVANPPFGLENSAVDMWAQDRFGRNRWGAVTKKPADLAFVAHMASSMKGVDGKEDPTGRAAIVLPMGALFRKGAEGETRKRLLEAGLVDAVIALPDNMFFNTSIPASILVLRADKRRGDKVLFVDASQCFAKVKKQNTMTPEQQKAVVEAYQSGETSNLVRTKLIPVGDIVKADSDLTVTRWLPQESSVVVDVPAALAALRKAEASADESARAFWLHMKEAGYVE